MTPKSYSEHPLATSLLKAAYAARDPLLLKRGWLPLLPSVGWVIRRFAGGDYYWVVRATVHGSLGLPLTLYGKSKTEYKYFKPSLNKPLVALHITDPRAWLALEVKHTSPITLARIAHEAKARSPEVPSITLMGFSKACNVIRASYLNGIPQLTKPFLDLL